MLPEYTELFRLLECSFTIEEKKREEKEGQGNCASHTLSLSLFIIGNHTSAFMFLLYVSNKPICYANYVGY